MLPSTRRVSAPDPWLTAYRAGMEPLFKRGDEVLACARAEVARSRDLHGRERATCIYCDGSRQHTVWCMDANVPRPS